MARLKKGLDFFYFDVTFYDDIKIRKLIRYHGAQAVVVYQLILVRIYNEGYYLNWDDDISFIIAEVAHLEDVYVNTVINYCIEIGLFDKALFEQSKILTSQGIQNRFFDFCVVSKRKVSADSPYLLIDLSQKAVKLSKLRNNSEKNDDYSEQSLIFSEESNSEEPIIPNNSEKDYENSEFEQQSKVKESKEYIDSSLRSESQSSDTPMTVKDDEINFLAFLDFFNRAIQEHHAQIPTITQISQKRQQMLKARAREHGKEALRKAVLNAVAAPFLNGASDKPFVASFDWIFRPLNFVKVLEGNYNHAITNPNSQSYGTDNNNGYRTAEDLRQGAADIISRRAAARQHPKRELPVV